MSVRDSLPLYFNFSLPSEVMTFSLEMEKDLVEKHLLISREGLSTVLLGLWCFQRLRWLA